MKILKYFLSVALVCGCMGLAPQAKALLIGDAHEMGFVQYGIPSGDQDREDYVNAMIDLPMGGSITITRSGQDNLVTRSMHDFGPLSDAVFALNGTSTSIDLGSGYDYLFAKYDGPNYGAEVWFVGDLSGVITIPAKAGKYGLSGWTLFSPDNPSVPDGGATVALFGLALGAVGLIQRLRIDRVKA